MPFEKLKNLFRAPKTEVVDSKDVDTDRKKFDDMPKTVDDAWNEIDGPLKRQVNFYLVKNDPSGPIPIRIHR